MTTYRLVVCIDVDASSLVPIEEALKPEFRRDHGQLDSTRGYWINGPEHRYCSKKNAP